MLFLNVLFNSYLRNDFKVHIEHHDISLVFAQHQNTYKKKFIQTPLVTHCYDLYTLCHMIAG